VIVRVHQPVVAARASKDLRCAIGEHFVRVHVVRGARARLVHVHDELIAQTAGQYLVGRPDDGIRDGCVHPLERRVRLRRRFLDQDGGGDELRLRAQAADRKIACRPHRLDAVVGIVRDERFTERIALGAHRHC
jgi:hypothetical protein